MPKDKLISLGILEVGFSVMPSYSTPERLTSRDLWNVWNTVIREGEEFLGTLALHLDDAWITIHDDGDLCGLVITSSSEKSLPSMIRMHLKNDIIVLWDRNLTVPQLRGAIL